MEEERKNDNQYIDIPDANVTDPDVEKDNSSNSYNTTNSTDSNSTDSNSNVGSNNTNSTNNSNTGNDGHYGYYNNQYNNQNPYNQNPYNNGNGYTGPNGYGNYGAGPSGNNGRKPKKNNAAKWIAIAACVIAGVGVIGMGSAFVTGIMNYKAVSGDDQLAMDNDSNKDSASGKEDASKKDDDAVATTKPVTVTESKGGTSGATDVSDIVEASMPSVASITSTSSQKGYSIFGQQYEQEVKSAGTGFIVGQNETELLLATNNHVVEDATGIQVTFADDSTAQAVVKGTDSTADLAVVAVKLSDIKDDTMKSIKVAVLGNSDDVKVGQIAIAIGNAQGMGQSVTVGYISAKNRELDMGNQVTGSKKMTFIQTDAAINGGNSGGPLLDINGNVVGINSAKISDTQVEGMCYAIPISSAIPIINDLMNRETLTEDEKGYMGVAVQDISSEAKEMYNVPDGVYVSSVSPNGPADKAGIVEGDIITEIDGLSVSSKSAAVDKITSNRAGTEITVSLYRKNDASKGYDKLDLKVTLANAKDAGVNTNKGSDNSSQGNNSDGNDGNGSNDNGSNGHGSNGNGSDGYNGDAYSDDEYNNGMDDWFNNMFPW